MASIIVGRPAIRRIASRIPGVVLRTDVVVQRSVAQVALVPRAARLVGSAAAFAAVMAMVEPAQCMEGAPKAKTVAKNGDEEDPTTEADSKATPAVSRAALAASGGAAGPDDEIDFAALVPDFGVELGLGVIAGFSSGYAVKKVGKLAALTVGLGFIAMQVARHYGVLKKEHMPDLSKLDRAIKASLDVDGDGKVTSKDLNTLANRGFSMLSANMPAASGFGVAFLFGLRYG